MEPASHAPHLVVRQGTALPGRRLVAEEMPVAIDYAGHTQAVLMATPAQLEDLAIGFTLTEGIVQRVAEIQDVLVISCPDGLVVRLWLDADRRQALETRRRTLAGPTGCGLCGVESLGAAIRPPPPVPPGGRFDPADIEAALRALSTRQVLGAGTRAVHAAALWRPGEGCVALREDVGRHNALDKLAGALARSGQSAEGCLVVLSSRVSVEMVQKAAWMRAAAIVAVSAPTALAVRTADAAGLTLIAVARADGFEVFTGAERLVAPRGPARSPWQEDETGPAIDTLAQSGGARGLNQVAQDTF
jgi:FdhD protein